MHFPRLHLRLLLVPFILLLLLVPPCCALHRSILGIAFSTGHDLWGYRQSFADHSLSRLKATGANYVQISVYANMSTSTALNYTEITDEQSIRYIIRKVKRRGLHVFLKPVIETDTWRGYLPGRHDWFRLVYIPFITHMARIARDEGVDLFAIGSEYRSTLGHVNEWLSVIYAVKKVYRGPITYIANHDSYFHVHFWHLLDYISISAYFSLLPGLTGPSPDMDNTKTKWEYIANRVNAWRKYRNLTSKQVLIAEYGAQSKGHGVNYRVPWDWQIDAPVDFYDQTKMYEGICAAFLPKQWVAGIIFWVWELRPYAGTHQPGISGYTPQNKPAERVLSKWFANRNYSSN